MKRTTGPRGGTTTVTQSGMVKKNFWLDRKLAERVRALAFQHRLPEAEIFRRAIEHALDHPLDLLSAESPEQ